MILGAFIYFHVVIECTYVSWNVITCFRLTKHPSTSIAYLYDLSKIFCRSNIWSIVFLSGKSSIAQCSFVSWDGLFKTYILKALRIELTWEVVERNAPMIGAFLIASFESALAVVAFADKIFPELMPDI